MDHNLLLSLSGGALAGVAVGMALKKAFRWALIFIGLVILGLMGLMNAGIVVIQWEALSQGLEGSVATIGDWVRIAVDDLSAQLVGFSGGLVIGLKWG